MSKFLDDFLVTMPTTQRQKLLELLQIKQQDGTIKSPLEFQSELENMLREIESREGGPTFKARKQEHQTNSINHNKNMNELLFDLATLFEASASIDRLLADNKQLSRSLLGSIKKSIHSLKSKLERYKLLMKNTDSFIDGVHEQFNYPEYTETDEKALQTLRKDRFDNYLDNTYDAENIGDALQLSGIETTDQLKTSYGRKLADIKVLNRTGTPSENPQHSIDKAIDGSLNTYWAESILVDQPITQNVNELWGSSYNGVSKDGAICELEIALNGITTVSDIQFDPFCSYPLEIVSIYGYETEDKGGKVYELISPNHENIYQRSKKSVNQMTFQFPSVEVSKLRILIRQENYLKENYLVNADEANNEQLWRKLSSDPELIDDYKDANETMAEFDKKNEITGWSVYLKKLQEWAVQVNDVSVLKAATTAMESVKTGDYQNAMLLKLQAMTKDAQVNINNNLGIQSSWQAVNKTSYLYGAYNISVFGRKYRNQSIYVTSPLPLSSNATRISLETVEKHHDIEIGPETTQLNHHSDSYNKARITDIEYYITHKKNPTSSDWQPILPVDKEYVKGELLLGDLVQGSYPELDEYQLKGESLIVYSFRFPVTSDQTVVLRRNGVAMSSKTYVISNDGKKIGILGKFYSASSIYTVDYKPADGAWIVNLNELSGTSPTQYINNNGETGESFAFADINNSITLKHKPYLFRKDLFNYNEEDNAYTQDENKLSSISPEFPIIVRVNGIEFKNITNYSSNSYDIERLTENDGKTFAQIGNTIVFGSPIDGGKIENINVDYYYVATDIRMKAILRRNSVEDESVTPALYSYHIRCQSYDQEV
ncbi:hypothetical protein O0R52_21560 (plasmid) [Bacillus halotolerans]|uniref:Uncharacterized protein n=1 Tax=Bacillus halotolerans TaxID=260554 RepID=A0ABY7I7Y4_9BACI|nr:hypothetical protein [Bacillus halotolerans]WAT23586.1 hypothetical protein O0R52_21560 [Bacillus halotolerans]